MRSPRRTGTRRTGTRRPPRPDGPDGAPPRSGLGRVAQRSDDVTDPLERLPLRQPLQLGDDGVRGAVVAGGLDQARAVVGVVGAVQPARDLRAGGDGVGVHAHRGAAGQGAGRVGVDVGVALRGRFDLAPLLRAGGPLGLEHPLHLVLELLVDAGVVLGAAAGRELGALAHGASCVGSAGQSSCRAPGLCTAVPPLFSLFTSYCGSSSLALTFRPAASVSEVISRCTMPAASEPWLFQVTWSPFSNSSAMTSPAVRSRVVRPPAPAPPRRRAHITRKERGLTPQGGGSGSAVTLGGRRRRDWPVRAAPRGHDGYPSASPPPSAIAGPVGPIPPGSAGSARFLRFPGVTAPDARPVDVLTVASVTDVTPTVRRVLLRGTPAAGPTVHLLVPRVGDA